MRETKLSAMTKDIYTTVIATCQFFSILFHNVGRAVMGGCCYCFMSICLLWWILQVIYSDWFLAGFLTKKHHNASHLILILLRLQSVAIWAAARIVKSLFSVHTGFSSSKTETLQAIYARTCELKYFFNQFFKTKLLILWNQKAWSILGLKMLLHTTRKRDSGCLSLMCLCRGVGKWGRGSEGGCRRKRCINREGEEVCGWTLTALNSFLICHFYILFLPSWRHLMLQPRWHSRMRLSSIQISPAMRKSPNLWNVYQIYSMSFYVSPISNAQKSHVPHHHHHLASVISRLHPHYSLHQLDASCH